MQKEIVSDKKSNPSKYNNKSFLRDYQMDAVKRMSNGTILNGNFTDAVKVDLEGNMTVPAIKNIIARLEALENKN